MEKNYRRGRSDRLAFTLVTLPAHSSKVIGFPAILFKADLSA